MDEHTLNDLLECSVCLDRLDTSSKVLPCQHTFCRKCLEVIVCSRQELRCPECRVLVNIKIDDLPPNVLLMRILEGLKNVAAKAHQEQDPAASPKANSNADERVQTTGQKTQTTANQMQMQQQHQQQKQPQTQRKQQNVSTPSQRRCLLPHAYALFDFETNEPSDLHFKKGDLILLKRRIDIHWYVGQSNGCEGTFPSNYVQVIVPLPSPQCIALYDFKMGPNEEEGCLSFKKGTVIQVLRRVDANWAEGCIGSTIGIFPIAFAEMNPLAKKLLDTPHMQSKNSPVSAAANSTNAAAVGSPSAAPPSVNEQQPRDLPPIPPLLDPTTSTTSPNSSDSTTPTSASSSASGTVTTGSSSNSNSNSSSSASSPQHAVSVAGGSVRYREGREKRHSLNALLSAGITAGRGEVPSLSVLQRNRHSAEILSVPNDAHAVAASSAVASNAPRTAAADNALQPGDSGRCGGGRESVPRVNVLKTGGQQAGPPPLPWGYLALYPYKPRKADELELKKGCVYIVTERCLDGWFKGKNWQDISGVFPGNYVAPLRTRDQQQLMHQWKFVLEQATPASAAPPPAPKDHSSPVCGRGGLPDLPPRQLLDAGQSPNAATTTSCASVWTKPLGHTMDVLFHRGGAKTAETNATKDKDCNKARENGNTPVAQTPSSTSTAVNLMKRLAIMTSTRSKSPVEHANNVNNAKSPQASASHGQHPVHVRSGSCPSQLLQPLPSASELAVSGDGKTNNKVQEQQQQQHAFPQKSIYAGGGGGGGSQRLKENNKNRPPLLSARQSMDASAFRGMYSSGHQQQPPSAPIVVMANKCGQQQQQQHMSNSNIHHRKSQSLDAAQVLNSNSAAAPAAVNHIVPAGITAAAIAASATTKSASGRESRFRCVVPYPPNSDVELELHVGDIIYVHRKQRNGWYKGTDARSQKTGLFPASFVEPDM